MNKQSTKQYKEDYNKGVSDCAEGVLHKELSKAYTRGYSDQYTKEQLAKDTRRY